MPEWLDGETLLEAADRIAGARDDVHLADGTDAHDASAISIVDAGNDFTATDVEGALAELQADNEAHVAAGDPHTGYLLEGLVEATSWESPTGLDILAHHLYNTTGDDGTVFKSSQAVTFGAGTMADGEGGYTIYLPETSCFNYTYGGYYECKTPYMMAGTYTLDLSGEHAASDRTVLQVSVDGNNVGSAVDFQGGGTGLISHEISTALSLSAGRHTVRATSGTRNGYGTGVRFALHRTGA